jgi:hypothetical protein
VRLLGTGTDEVEARSNSNGFFNLSSTPLARSPAVHRRSAIENELGRVDTWSAYQ